MIPATDDFHNACNDFGIELEPGEADRLHAFLDVLYEANQTTNLTAIRDEADAWMRHIFDALTLLPVLAELEPGEGDQIKVCDVGSGGGVPAIPLAIVRPDVSFTMLEATSRKTKLLESFIEKLGLTNISVVNGRAERLGAFEGGELRDGFDLVTARALGRVTVASELCVPLARKGGIIALIKGQKADEELAEAKKALHMLHVGHTGTIDTPTGRIVILEKLRPTPKAYPRRDGEPKRAPL